MKKAVISAITVPAQDGLAWKTTTLGYCVNCCEIIDDAGKLMETREAPTLPVAQAIARWYEGLDKKQSERELQAQDLAAHDEWLDNEGEECATSTGIWFAALAYERNRVKSAH